MMIPRLYFIKVSTFIFVFNLLAGNLSYSQDPNQELEEELLNDADEIAKALANPNATLGFLSLPIDYINYTGDLPNANSQHAFKISFQPSLPYPIAEGANFFFRPLIPLVITQPVPIENGFDNRGVALGDIAFDAAVGKTWPTGWVTIVGLASSLPTATDKALGSGRWNMGPEFFLGHGFKWGFAGVLFNQLWSITGNKNGGLSIFGGQYFYTVNLPKAWQIQAQPTFSVNWNATKGNKTTFPIGIGISKTMVFGKLPFKIGLQYWYFVASPDNFGPQHQVRLAPTPVIPLPW